MSLAVLDELLRTEHLILRRFTPQDARLLHELDSDPQVMRFITGGKPTPLAQIEKEILPRVLSYYLRTPPQGVWAAHHASDHDFIGWFHLRADKFEPEEMELGYRLKRSAWGQGFATEGSLALLQQGFTVWDHEKISARTLKINAASRRVMEKIGMRLESEFLYPPEMTPELPLEEREAVKYSLRREDYLKKHLNLTPEP